MENVEALLSAASTAVNAAKAAEERVEQLRQMTLFRRGSHNDRDYTSNEDTSTLKTIKPASFIDKVFDGVLPFLGKLINMFIWASILLFTSSGMYALFYFMIMPSLVVQRDVYFDYMHTFTQDKELQLDLRSYGGLHDTQQAAARSVVEPLLFRDPVPGDEVKKNIQNGASLQECISVDEIDAEAKNIHKGSSATNKLLSPWPTAWLDLHAAHSQWEAFAEDVSPIPLVKDRVLHPSSKYWMEVCLIMPESLNNVNLGIFVLQLELLDTSKQILARSKRPVHFPYSSVFIRHVRKVFGMIPLALGAIPEARSVTINVIDQYVESESRPLQYVRISLLYPHQNNGAKAASDTNCASSSELRQVQVISAEFHIGKELNPLQKFMKVWFFTATILGVSILFVAKLCVICVFKVFLCQLQSNSFGHVDAEVSENVSFLNSISSAEVQPQTQKKCKNSRQPLERKPRSQAIVVDDTFDTTPAYRQLPNQFKDDVLDLPDNISFGSGLENYDGDVWEDMESKGEVTISSKGTFLDENTSSSKVANSSVPCLERVQIETSKHQNSVAEQSQALSGPNRQKPKHSKKKKHVLAKDVLAKKEAEDAAAERVMKGFTGPYEIFTGEERRK